jgi:hypothetical protein
MYSTLTNTRRIIKLNVISTYIMKTVALIYVSRHSAHSSIRLQRRIVRPNPAVRSSQGILPGDERVREIVNWMNVVLQFL